MSGDTPRTDERWETEHWEAARYRYLLDNAGEVLWQIERELHEARAEVEQTRKHVAALDADLQRETSALRLQRDRARAEVEQLRAALRGARDWLGCIDHFPDGCPDDCAQFIVIQQVDRVLTTQDENP